VRNTSQLLSFYKQIRATAAPIYESPLHPLPAEALAGASGPTISNTAITRANDRIAEFQTEVTRIETSLLALRSDRALWLNRFRQLQTEFETTQRRFATFTREITLSTPDTATPDHARAAELESKFGTLGKTLGRLSAEDALYPTPDLHPAPSRDSDVENEVLRHRLHSATEDFSFIARSLENAQQTIDALRTQIDVRDTKIAHMQKSLSWRLTGPLRTIRRLLFLTKRMVQKRWLQTPPGRSCDG